MKAIGQIMAYVLLATAFTKNMFATSATNIKFSKDSNKIARYNTTKLEMISDAVALLNSDTDGLRSILVNIFESKPVQDLESRTFGGNKRFQFMLMPMMYKMGVMMTMLMVIAAISAKGLLIAKLHSGWHAPWPSPQPWLSPQPVHLHVHNAFPVHPHMHPQIYQSWDSSGPAYEDQYYYKG
ncbi:PREDICTED: uncharacterized protein LOC105143595 isoform X2 [Acromyrmex echinatior]|uniref:uncharacterized protein LOC105143595 isoform X2 n=1 Tax=Acromyrmex echinatior TaxID=103372 RepID=UPI000580C9A5|nr:PREDICTED: uncharacterized protein LOC105143595 isoform X2 [Acromyrmex echinatior]